MMLLINSNQIKEKSKLNGKKVNIWNKTNKNKPHPLNRAIFIQEKIKNCTYMNNLD